MTEQEFQQVQRLFAKSSAYILDLLESTTLGEPEKANQLKKIRKLIFDKNGELLRQAEAELTTQK